MEQHIPTLIAIIILVLASAFFSASETAYTSANRIRLKNRADNGNKAARRALAILERYDKTLTTILIGNNIVNILTSSLATVMCIALWGDKGSLISTVSVTIVVLVFGEIIPKTVSKLHAESFACAVSGFMTFLCVILTPLSAFFIVLQKGASRLFGSKGREVSMTEQELIKMIDEIEDEGVLEEQESDLVRSALVFDETLVSAVITPRVSVAAADVNTDIEDMRELFLREEYSRIPVYEKTIDHIIGVVKHKDFFEKLVKGESFYLRDIMQETIFIPDLMKISDVLKTMQKSKIHLAVVIDQYGGTEGIVTLEDILEELVGEIWDETDEVTAPVRAVGENIYETGGELSIKDFNRYFDGRFKVVSESNTVGGWIFELFGRIPSPGDRISTPGADITVLSLDELRVGRIRLVLTKKPEPEE